MATNVATWTNSRHGRLSTSFPKSPRRAFGLVVAGFVLASAAIASPSPTSAATWGAVGVVQAPRSVCQQLNGIKYMYIASTGIYASNRTAGSGNDLQFVRYWTRVINANGVPLTSWSLAGSGYANDNAPASLPGLLEVQ